MSKFALVNSIVCNSLETWEDKIFLTFDLDWCDDEVLAYTLDILERYDVRATFFVTHYTPLLDRMRENPKIELGIHPNFNFLLNGDFRLGKNIDEVIEFYIRIVPDAISVRSHSLTRNSYLMLALKKFGLVYELNILMLFDDNIKPFIDSVSGIVSLPHLLQDDVICMRDRDEFRQVSSRLSNSGLKILDFHPIHIFLNSSNMSEYINAKQNNFKINANSKQRLKYGAEDCLIEIIKGSMWA